MAPVHRLSSSRDIRDVFARRISAGTSLVVVHVRPRDDPAGDRGSRVAVVAGRRVGNAVTRNRAKRRLRAALRDATVPDGYDVVVTAKPPVVDAPFVAVVTDVDSAVRRAARKVGGPV